MDVHTRENRSYNMSQIKGKNTKPEETVRKYLFGRGLRYRKNDKSELKGDNQTTRLNKLYLEITQREQKT